MICPGRAGTAPYLPQPVGVGKREIREGAFPLHEVPGSADVVVPRDDPLHGVADQVDVDGGGEIKSKLVCRTLETPAAIRLAKSGKGRVSKFRRESVTCFKRELFFANE